MNAVHNYVGNNQGQEELYLVVFLIQETELIKHELTLHREKLTIDHQFSYQMKEVTKLNIEM